MAPLGLWGGKAVRRAMASRWGRSRSFTDRGCRDLHVCGSPDWSGRLCDCCRLPASWGAPGAPASRACCLVPCMSFRRATLARRLRHGVGMKPTTITQPHDLAPFAFQRLEIYVQSRELAAGVHRAGIGDAELRDQATRAAKSLFLNVSEGLPDAQLGVRRRHFSIARNSLCEVAAAVDLAVAIGALSPAVAGELVGRLQRVAALLAGLLR
jgi:four helix bundle protein